MTFFTRAAAMAAVTLCAGAMLGATSPGLALEPVSEQVIGTSNNAAYPGQVPTPPAPIVPAEWTPEERVAPVTAPAEPAAEADYTSLSQAVAAQGVPDSPDDELRCLATGVYFESKGEPLAGQLAVAEVILNRTRSGRYPSSVCSVLKQRGQFSFVRGGRMPSVARATQAWRTAVAVAKVARHELWESKASNAMFFHARHVAPGWNRARVASLGNHIFYR